MKNKEKEGGFFENLGKILGYLDLLNISILGIILITLGIVTGFFVVDAEFHHPKSGDTMAGSALISAALILGGAIMHAAKRIRR
ncbi:hypothetical protein V2O64_07915 [Verrucomicrobiaceae bacterium 227]